MTASFTVESAQITFWHEQLAKWARDGLASATGPMSMGEMWSTRSAPRLQAK